MWGMKATKIPVVRSPGTGNIQIHEVQKITLLGTSHILRRTFSIKYTSTSF